MQGADHSPARRQIAATIIHGSDVAACRHDRRQRCAVGGETNHIRRNSTRRADVYIVRSRIRHLQRGRRKIAEGATGPDLACLDEDGETNALGRRHKEGVRVLRTKQDMPRCCHRRKPAVAPVSDSSSWCCTYVATRNEHDLAAVSDPTRDPLQALNFSKRQR